MCRLAVCAAALLLLLAPSQVAYAQIVMVAPTEPDSALRTLTVTGMGEATSASTRGTLRIAFATEGETVEEALATHEEEVARVSALLRDSGVPESDIFLDRTSVGAVDEDDYGGSATSGELYVADRLVTVYLSDLASIPRLMAEIVRSDRDGLLTVHRRSVDVAYTLADRSALRAEALREAVADAQRRAELIAAASGLRLGAVLSLSEQGVQAAMFGVGAASANAEAMSEMSAGRSGAHRVEAGVVVVYEVR
jgi:uncharacterized protein YggE